MTKIYTFILALVAAGTLSAQVTLVKDINEGTGNSSPANLTTFGGKIYFAADDAGGTNTGGTDYGKELWISDGTADGTTFVKDIRDGSSNSSPSMFFELNGELFFLANDGNGASQIWTTDGTEAGTTNTNNGFSIMAPIVVNNIAYMTATTNSNAFYTFDGTTGAAVADTGSGTPKVTGGKYIALDNNTILLYMEYSTEADTYGLELYKYDITAQTYTLVKDVVAGEDNSGISNFTLLGDNVYFEAENALWVTDGTEAGTMEVAAASSLGGVANVVAFAGKILFEGDNGTDGDQLYAYDPTADTLANISNIGGDNAAHDPSDYVEYDGYLYYSGEDETDNKKHLFRTDASTVEQLDDTIIDVDDLAVLNDVIYFEGDEDGVTGNELYSFDPETLSVTTVTVESTKLVLYPNPVTDAFYVKGADSGKYQIFSIKGQLVQSGDFTEGQSIGVNLVPGVYFVQINNGEKTTTKKVLVK